MLVVACSSQNGQRLRENKSPSPACGWRKDGIIITKSHAFQESKSAKHTATERLFTDAKCCQTAGLRGDRSRKPIAGRLRRLGHVYGGCRAHAAGDDRGSSSGNTPASMEDFAESDGGNPESGLSGTAKARRRRDRIVRANNRFELVKCFGDFVV
jgi:hypothetical protein